MATKKNKQIQQALIKFYHNPVAKVSFELFLTIFGVIFFAIFAIRPTLLTMSDLIKEIEDKEKLDKQLQRKVAALSTAQQEYQLYGDQLQLVDEAIPDRMQLIKTLKIIEKIASEQDLIISDLRLASIPNEGRKTLTSENIARIDQGLELSVMGSYPSIRDFVESLQQSRRTLVANVVEFNIKEDRSQTTLEATMTISIPYFKAKNE
ncbi:MAG: type 4a pilus biogenesis protein PilO [Patescibacteria group bacterium]|nr:type 4a pilus biogenesis protein PilO [Patescibacteria group bacterium]